MALFALAMSSGEKLNVYSYSDRPNAVLYK
jgi:hypothetical protein